jgi:hypothetical protein
VSIFLLLLLLRNHDSNPIDKGTTVELLLEQCFSGFALNNCQDTNTTIKKDYSFSSQFTDIVYKNNQYCLQCCSKPVPVTGADETWALVCPLNDLQRLSVSQGKKSFRFARRATLDDKTIIECPMPTRSPSTYLKGYNLTLTVMEMSQNLGSQYWRSVVSCSLTILETIEPPTFFYETIRLISIPSTTTPESTILFAVLMSLSGIFLILSPPIYHAWYRGNRCLHCGGWLVYINQMCAICMIIGCRLHPPPPLPSPKKIYVAKDKTAANSSRKKKSTSINHHQSQTSLENPLQDSSSVPDRKKSIGSISTTSSATTTPTSTSRYQEARRKSSVIQ